MQIKKSSFIFLIILLEWYEFTIYNLTIPYIFGGTNENAIYLGFFIFALSFLARPIGAMYFSSKTDRTASLRTSLGVMCISTILIALFPPQLESMKLVWFGCCKIAQGFALGGSYGLGYVSIYESEELKVKKQTNYKLAKVQIGWAIGMLIGEFTVFLIKLTLGNQRIISELLRKGDFLKLIMVKPAAEFTSWGWRLPFLASGLIGGTLYLLARKRKAEIVDLPCTNIASYIVSYIRRYPVKFLLTFSVITIDMIIAHVWLTYCEVAKEASNAEVLSNLTGNLRLVLLMILLPIMGKITDKLNQSYDNKGSYIVLFCVCIMMIISGLFAPWTNIIWIPISAFTMAGCYGSLMSWAISRFEGIERQVMIGPMFNFASALVGGTVPLTAAYVADRFGNAKVGWLMIGYASMSLISLVLSFMRNNKNRTRTKLLN